MAELCLVGYTYRGYKMAYALDRAREFGYSGIELRDFADIDLSSPSGVADALKRAKRLAEEYGLAIYSVFYAPLPISRENERASEEHAFAKVLSILSDFDVDMLHTRLSLRRRDDRGEIISAGAHEADYAAITATLARIVPSAREHGVRIAIETHMGTVHDTTTAQLRIVSALESPYLTASLDFANMIISYPEESLVEATRSFGARIGYTHIKNIKRTPLGYDWNLPVRWGDINYYRVLRALQEVSYDGPLGVEYCGTGDPDVFAEDDARYLAGLATRVGI